jgi:tetratricopeptide (TPR) repeat protein
MSSHNEQVKPTAFDVADESQAGKTSSIRERSSHAAPIWVVPLLLLLAVLAVVVVFWLPGRIDPQTLPPIVAKKDVSPVLVKAKDGTAKEEPSPWSEAQLAKLRKEAQDMLADLLDVQFQLEEIGVEQWAEGRVTQAKVVATEGDAQYRERQFIEAKASYGRALEALHAVLDSAPMVLQENLERAHRAIDDGQSEVAHTALAVAAAIEPLNEELASLTQRAAALEQILSLLAQAGDAEERADLATAEGLLQQARALDPKHPRVRSELARVAAAHNSQRFNAAMSDGYLALDGDHFSQARSAFKKAAQLVPGAAETTSALQEVQSAETAFRLVRLQREGQAYESKEQWQDAVDVFEQARQIDDSLKFAQEGLNRSKARNQLDKQFRTTIDNPERLSDKEVAEATAELLRQANKISPRGPILQQQISQVGSLLQTANTPITVIMRSDMETEVTLRKVERLGRFQQQELTLRPGTYTAVGTRDGYRDVRRTFTVSHDRKVPAVVVTCTEQI